MTLGLVVGKFYPPHAGHHELIRTARSQCDELIVLVAAGRAETVPLDQRRSWLAELHPDVEVRSSIDDNPTDYDDPRVWEVHVRVFKEAVPERLDFLFTSEAYGDELARRMGARHVAVDPGREIVSVSGTAVRTDPIANWHHLAAPVRAYLTKRVVVLGAESSGTTTMARALAEHYSTSWVSEYAWKYCEEKLRAGTFETWRPDEFVTIASRQQASEDEAARTAGPVMFCDTDALATCVWEERYLGRTSHRTEQIASQRVPALYLLTDTTGVPFEPHPLRDGEHIRHAMTGRFRERLEAQRVPWLELRGAREERMAAAVHAVDGVLAAGWSFTPPA